MDNLNLISENLLKHEVKDSFGIPGGGNSLKLIDNFEKNNIKFHLTKFEGSASIMAATLGKLTEKVGVSISIKGPGFVNAIPGIAFSYFESLPLLHITEAYASNVANHFAHKRLNHEEICNSFVKDTKYIDSINQTHIELISTAMTEEPGPVVLQLVEGQNKKSKNNVSRENLIYEEIDHNIFDKIKKPLLIVGSIACRKKIQQYFSKFNIPIFTTVAAKGFFDENKLNSAGIYTGVGLSLTPEYQLLEEADFIFCIGLNAKEVLSVNSFKTSSYNFELHHTPGIEDFNFSKRLHLNKFIEIVEKLNTYSWGTKELIQIKKTLFESLDIDFLPAQVYKYVNENYGNNCRIIFDTGNFCTIGEHVIKSSNNKNILFSANSRFMGTSIPMGIAASIFDTTLKTIVFVGDGGIGMFLSELELAVNYNLPLVIILLTDYSFASIRSRSIECNLTQTPLLMNNISWIKIIEGFGIPSLFANNLNDLENAFNSIQNLNGPFFIQVEFNKEKYLKMTNNLR